MNPIHTATARPRWASSLFVLWSTAVLPLAALAQTTAVGAAPAASPSSTATLVATGSEIGFITRQMGVPVEGKFGKFSAQIALDPKKPEAGKVALSIDTASARFGSAELDAEVGKPVWLAAAKFPHASFQSSSVKATGPGKFEVKGQLSIKGQAREVVVPVQLAQAAGQSTATGSFVIKRLEFKVGEGDWADTSMLANDITVRFKLVLTGVAPM